MSVELTNRVKIHKRLLEPHCQEALTLTGLAAIQQTIDTHVLVPAEFEWVGHQIQSFESRGVKLHVLGEVVVQKLELAMQVGVRKKGKVGEERGECGHRVLQFEFG